MLFMGLPHSVWTHSVVGDITAVKTLISFSFVVICVIACQHMGCQRCYVEQDDNIPAINYRYLMYVCIFFQIDTRRCQRRDIAFASYR